MVTFSLSLNEVDARLLESINSLIHVKVVNASPVYPVKLLFLTASTGASIETPAPTITWISLDNPSYVKRYSSLI